MPEVASSPFAQKPVLVFWETTKACRLACLHCRAAAEPRPRPGELSTEEGLALLEQVRAFGEPPPVLVLTGGDLLLRPDLERLLAHARTLGLPVAVSPAVTPLLDADRLASFAAYGVRALSLSIDGLEATHDRIRGVPGTFRASLAALAAARAVGLSVQVNTVVMRPTLADLAELAALLRREGVPVWEVFFLVPTGRAAEALLPTPEEVEDVLHFLLDVSRSGMAVRTVEGPFLRRVLRQRLTDGATGGALHRSLLARYRELLGEAAEASADGDYGVGRRGTLDGDGIVFVAHDGEIFPGGLLPVPLGNVRRDDLVVVYRTHPLLRAIRARAFHGPCGRCPERAVCGGSRARAYALTGDALGSDPSCREATLAPR